jgi:ferredoxin
MSSEKTTDSNPARFDRREALWSAGALAVGGVLGSLMGLTGCRATEVYRDFPDGAPTGYIIDPTVCTQCGDCERVCRCDAVPHTGHPEDPDHKQCWIDISKCCACGRCFRVCDVDAIVPMYGTEKKPRRPIPKYVPGQFGWRAGDNPAKSAHCALHDPPADAQQQLAAVGIVWKK